MSACALARAGQLDADEDARRGAVGDAVVELGHAPIADQLAEPLEAAAPLGDGHGEDRLALLAHLGPLGDEPQPIEVHVRAAGHHGDRPVERRARRVGLGPRHAERARRLEDGTRLLKHVLDGGAEGVVVDLDDVVDVAAAEAKGLASDPSDRGSVGEEPHLAQRDPTSGDQRARHRVRVDRLHADDLDLGTHRLDVGGDAGDEPATADRNEDRAQRPVVLRMVLAKDLQAHRPLPRDHVGIVERVHERQLASPLQDQRVRVGVGERIAVQHHLGAEGADGGDLHLGRRGRHDDEGARAELARGERHPLRVVAGAGRDHAPPQDRGGQVDHLVVGAAQLEAEDRLQILALEQDRRAETRRQLRREVERRLDGDVVDAGVEDPLQVRVGGHASTIASDGPARANQGMAGMVVTAGSPQGTPAERMARS